MMPVRALSDTNIVIGGGCQSIPYRLMGAAAKWQWHQGCWEHIQVTVMRGSCQHQLQELLASIMSIGYRVHRR